MAKQIETYIKLQVPAGAASPSPPVGPALGQHGLPLMDFCNAFNARTKEIEPGMPCPVVITVYEDKSCDFVIKTTPASGAPQFNFSISPTGDIDLVGGNDNMMQAIELKMNTYRGELPLHKGYGFVPMVGVKGTRNLNFNLYLSLNDTMLSDARIEDLSNVRISTKGDETAVSFRANIIGQVPYVPVTFTTKG